jgi:glutaredoxin
MSKALLFSLENCVKCTQTKELLTERDDIEIVTFPHDVGHWTTEDFALAKTYNVFDDLQKTAPILWVDGEKSVGFLRIKKWIQDKDRKE